MNKIMTIEETKKAIEQGRFDDDFKFLYNDNEKVVNFQRKRYLDAIDEFSKTFEVDGNTEIRIFSAPGRSEICGNHTDHNLGKVLTASVNLDIIGIVQKTESNIINVQSKGFIMDKIDILNLEPLKSEFNKSASLIRGVAAKFSQEGHKIGGFNSYTVSSVLKGSGLSSSAAFEVLIGTILNGLYNESNISAVDIAKYSQFAENNYFGKASGLLDQLTSSVGGFITADFADGENPIIEKVDFDFASSGYDLIIVDTKGSHADLSDDYSDIPKEMKQIANFFGKNVLREVDEDEFYKNIDKIRKKISDRAVIRAIHYFNENKRVDEQSKALKNGDFETFKELIIQSGDSSYKYLQNIFTTKYPENQSLSLALAMAEKILSKNHINKNEKSGGWRVHGGGFAGTIQAFVPHEKTDFFKKEMNNIFGQDSNCCYVLSVRPVGGTEILSK